MRSASSSSVTLLCAMVASSYSRELAFRLAPRPAVSIARQRRQDDAPLAAIHHVVVVIAQHRRRAGAHWRSVEIGPAHSKIGCAAIATNRRAVRIEPPLLQQPPGSGILGDGS